MVNKAFKRLKINNDNIDIDLTLRPEKISEISYYKISELYEKVSK
tara:strand:+ start:347 stop:481 length:135 start_codon:yes stop_codon:yes gene_type:complete